MPALNLSTLFRRDAVRPTLRQRAASLKAGLSQIRSQPRSLPEPGSAEAKAAFKAACHEHSIRTQFANEYPELKRTPLEWWTADSIGKALETGELSPAECARLYPLATERELRMAEIEHELNIAGLFALAYADEYPVKVQAAEQPQEALPRATHLLDQADIRAETLEGLIALHDTANLVADMAHAMCWQGRCRSRDWDGRTSQRDEYNAAGRLMQWLGDEMTEVVGLAVREATQRTPSSETDREARLALMARSVIEDGDHEKTAALARELADHAAGSEPA